MNLTNKAKSLRKNQTDVEQLLWKHLRNRNLSNHKFRRQFPIAPYIADFACLELKKLNDFFISPHPTLSLWRGLFYAYLMLCTV
ncbi:MAG: DUF559 domain-containing protein [Methylococcales bacterium]|nr:DUF559 domain-containing protein [Methylococcales bacterium]